MADIVCIVGVSLSGWDSPKDGVMAHGIAAMDLLAEDLKRGRDLSSSLARSQIGQTHPSNGKEAKTR